MSNDSFLFYLSWWRNIKEEYQDAETQLALIGAICEYGLEGVKTYPCEALFLRQVYSQIDSAQAKWEDIRQKRSEAGKRGGAPKGNQNASKQAKQAKTSKNNHNDNENDNVNVNDNVNSYYHISSSSLGYADASHSDDHGEKKLKRWEDMEEGEYV